MPCQSQLFSLGTRVICDGPCLDCLFAWALICVVVCFLRCQMSHDCCILPDLMDVSPSFRCGSLPLSHPDQLCLAFLYFYSTTPNTTLYPHIHTHMPDTTDSHTSSASILSFDIFRYNKHFFNFGNLHPFPFFPIVYGPL